MNTKITPLPPSQLLQVFFFTWQSPIRVQRKFFKEIWRNEKIKENILQRMTRIPGYIIQLVNHHCIAQPSLTLLVHGERKQECSN